MRWALLWIAVAATTAYAAPQSDPAFLGVSMGWIVDQHACVIESVTIGSPAHDAGISELDAIVSLDAIPIDSASACNDVTTLITRHNPGDTIAIQLRRGAGEVTVKPILATRSDVLGRRVGQRALSTDLADTDGKHWDLAEHRGQTLVVGAYSDNCAGCAAVIDRVADKLGRRAPAAIALAVLGSDRELSEPVLRGMRGTVPLALADQVTYANLATTDLDRVFFMVIDCRGVVKLVAPIAPEADDIPAAIDEVLAAVEQAEHARTRR
ncbi:MAG TPA: PDZ domain-containing protein [Kofleriaceae bacterium]|nr:PDZ domain-containing protein [Kofleriaceae bacterium]